MHKATDDGKVYVACEGVQMLYEYTFEFLSLALVYWTPGLKSTNYVNSFPQLRPCPSPAWTAVGISPVR
jgi:hypothetical protein